MLSFDQTTQPNDSFKIQIIWRMLIMFDQEQYQKRMKWFTDARFGMFIHWGLYAIPARGEWIRNIECIPKESYQVYFDEFTAKDYNPKKWAKLAKEAGMKYMVLTAKHHDGFCLFDSALTDYKSTNTPAKRDLVAEYVEAVREEGLKVGLYYSLLDWYHEDYPHYSDSIHPMRGNKNYPDDHRDFNRYLEYMHGQVKELCTNYGKIDILWFDYSYDNMTGEKWKAKELVEMVRSLQPDVIIDNRLEASGSEMGSLYNGNPTPYHGDFVSPEQIIPPEGIRDINGNPLIWETCITMNNNWGYCGTDHDFKPASMLIHQLVECVSKGGNLLLNVGPDAYGNIPEESISILKSFKSWMKKNSDSIYECTWSDLPKPEYGRITKKGNKLYFHMFENTICAVPLIGLKAEQIKKIRFLATGQEVSLSHAWNHNFYPDIAFANIKCNTTLPDAIDTVLEVELYEEL